MAVGMYEKFRREARMQGDAFPLENDSLLLFVAWLSKRGVRRSTIAQYLSAIRHENERLASDNPERVIELALKGVENLRAQQRSPAEVRPAWSSRWVFEAADLLEKMMKSRNPNVADMQALAASLFGFLFAQRSDTTLDVRQRDVKIEHGMLIFHEWTRKTKQQRSMRKFEIPIHSCAVAATIAKFTKYMTRNRSRSEEPMLLSLWQMSASSSKVLDCALRRVRELLNLPREDSQASHALRRGAACAMFAVGVPIERILSWGGWATEHSLRPYLKDRVWTPPTEHDIKCFGWMKIQSSVSSSQQSPLV